MVLCVQWICLLGLQAVDWTSGCSVGFWATLPVNFGGRCLSSRSCPCFLAAGWLAIFVVLSSVVGVLLAHFVLGCFRQSCGTLGLLDTEQSLVTWGPAVSLRSIGFCRWPQRWLGLLALGWCIRVGEASVPGPDSSSCGSHERTFQIGVCNPNGLVDKAMFFTDMEEDLWCVSETHLSQAGRRSFLKMMHAMPSNIPRFSLVMMFSHGQRCPMLAVGLALEFCLGGLPVVWIMIGRLCFMPRVVSVSILPSSTAIGFPAVSSMLLPLVRLMEMLSRLRMPFSVSVWIVFCNWLGPVT